MPVTSKFFVVLFLLIAPPLFFFSCSSSERTTTNTVPTLVAGNYFELPYELSSGENPTTLLTADSNSDGTIDLLYVLSPLRQESSNAAEHGVVEILQRDSISTAALPFSSSTLISPTSPSWRQHIALADVDGDKISDLLITESDKDNVTVYKGSGDGISFAEQSTTIVGDKPIFITSGDWNNDNHTDLAIVNRAGSSVTVMQNNGLGGSATSFNTTALDVGAMPIKVISSDWNSDTYSDLIVLSRDDQNITVWTNNGSGNFTLSNTLSTGANPQDLISGDWNNDGRVDFAVSNRQDGNLSLFYGLDNGSIAAGVLVTAGNGPGVFETSDFNNDNLSDFIVGHSFSFKSGADSYLGGEFSLILSKNNGETGQNAYESPELFASGTTTSGNIPASLLIVDINTDGKQDLLYSLPSRRKIAVLTGK